MTFRGFTLIELTAALVVCALLAAASSVVLSKALRGNDLADARSKLAWADTVARTAGERLGGGVVMRFQTGTGELSHVYPGSVKDARFRLARGVVVEQVRCAGIRVSSGTAEVPVSRAGYTPAYAVHITEPDRDSPWLVFAGISGYAQEISDERLVDQILWLSDRGHAP